MILEKSGKIIKPQVLKSAASSNYKKLIMILLIFLYLMSWQMS